MIRMSRNEPAVEQFQGHYYTRSALLHINCFYDGNCEPEEDITALIRETDSYIQEARNLASAA